MRVFPFLDTLGITSIFFIGFKFDNKVITWIRFRMTIQERIYDYGESENDINDF